MLADAAARGAPLARAVLAARRRRVRRVLARWAVAWRFGCAEQLAAAELGSRRRRRARRGALSRWVEVAARDAHAAAARRGALAQLAALPVWCTDAAAAAERNAWRACAAALCRWRARAAWRGRGRRARRAGALLRWRRRGEEREEQALSLG